ncbi:peptidase S10 [Candidatus Acetothermia bacterium]|nr:peptidase S10 [Candidatus Acetothermia bacterium]MBI3461162.1 peptidase S10 [Candidatus Acetothermia bacterium]MBI3660656.1 peptidase S10 [Candidatus Acetothermia bacterium]
MDPKENTEKNSQQNGEKTPETKPIPKDHIVETKHSITIGGREIRYTATVGTIILKEEAEKKDEKAGESEGEKAKASIFFVAYTRDDIQDKSAFPVTFSFNGGPGSSSVWLHLGLLGPQRVLMDKDGFPLPPPYKLVNNEHSLLEHTDLVFIDPVSTGYSRILPGEKAKEYHNFKKDIESVGDFIRLYTSRYKRWSSPKFLIGESYGTTRAAGLSGYLQERYGMYLNGLMLVSCILNFQTARFGPGNDMPYILFLPTYTATAWYHKKLPSELQKDLRATLKQVEEFASGEYTLALMKGAALSGAERKRMVQKLANFTGLSEDYIERTDLRINIHRFVKELLRDERRTVGRLDSRFKGFDRDSAGELYEHDPSMSAIMGPYTATLNDYVRAQLKFESDIPYEILTGRVQPWSFSDYENQFVNVAETLRKAMSINPHLRVFVANGYYDFATPYFATEYTFNHLGLDSSLQKNISMGYYEAGHMMYIHMPSLLKMKSDLSNFMSEALSHSE